jgi:hypothetical protein
MPLVQTRSKTFWYRDFSRGLLRDFPSDHIPFNAVKDCLNLLFIKNHVHKVWGYAPFHNFTESVTGNLSTKVPNGTPLRLQEVQFYNATREVLLCTTTDILKYNSTNSEWDYITPFLTTAGETAAVTNGSPTVTGTGTNWDTDDVNPGDFFHIDGDGDTWYEILTVDNATQITLASNYGGTTGSGKSYDIRLVFGGAATDKWVIAQLGNTIAFTNGVDLIQKWDGSAATVSVLGGLAGAGSDPTVTKAKYMATISGKLVIANLTDNGVVLPNRIRWSDRNDPEEWAASQSTEAGFDDILEDSGHILGLESCQHFGIVYKERNIVRITDEGTPYYFTSTVVSPNVGLFSPWLVGNYGTFHVFVSPYGFMELDGFNVRPIEVAPGKQAVKNYFLSNFNTEQAKTAFTIVRKKHNLILFFFPTLESTGAPDEILVYDVFQRNFTKWRLGSITAGAVADIAPPPDSIALYETYRTGTVTVSGAVVTGTGTEWTTDPRIHGRIDGNGNDSTDDMFADTGSWFRVDDEGDNIGLSGETGDPSWERIKSIDSDTQITLEASYPTDYAVAKAYTITRYFVDQLSRPISNVSLFTGSKSLYYLLSNGQFFKVEGYRENDSEYDAWLETAETDFGLPDHIKTLRAINVESAQLSTGHKLDIQIGRRNTKEAAFTWSEVLPYPIDGTGKGKVFKILSSRFFKFRVLKTGMDDPWLLRGLGFEVEATSDVWNLIPSSSPFNALISPEEPLSPPAGGGGPLPAP